MRWEARAGSVWPADTTVSLIQKKTVDPGYSNTAQLCSLSPGSQAEPCGDRETDCLDLGGQWGHR